MSINSMEKKKLSNKETIKTNIANIYRSKLSKLSNFNTVFDLKILKMNTSSNRIQFFTSHMRAKNLLSVAELKSYNFFSITGMHIFTYLFGNRNTMTVSPNNIKGGIMKFKTNLLIISTIVSLSAISLPGLAESEPSNPSVNTSWQPYVGGSVGYSRMSAKNHWSDTGPSNTIVGKNNFNSKGFLGVLHVGIQKLISANVKVGGELYGFLQTHKASDETPGHFGSLKRDNGGGIKLKAGYLFDTHTSFYAHAGVEKAGFKYAVDLGDGASTTCKKYLWGAPFGVGIEAALSPAWIARLEYTHTVYQKWDTGVKALDSTTTSKAKISPSQDGVLLGLSYQI